MSGKEEIMSSMEQFERLQEKYLPKVDRKLIIDLFLGMREEQCVKPMYTVETFVEGGNSEEIRQEVIRMTGVAPQMHDRATHLVAHHKLNYELLKEIQDHARVKEVTGTYMGSDASIGASHEPSTPASRTASHYQILKSAFAFLYISCSRECEVSSSLATKFRYDSMLEMGQSLPYKRYLGSPA
jgi:hypothetical protein